MLYEFAKAAHIVSVIVWIAGMTVAAMTLRHPSPATLPNLRRFDRNVTTPAMLLTWAFGLFIAVQGGWFGDIWLSVKILLVLILSGLHGMITGRLRKAAWDGSTPSGPTVGPIIPVGFGLTLGIVLLVVTKAI